MSDLIWLHDAVNVADMADYTGLSVEDVKKVTDEVVKCLKALPTVDAVPVSWINKHLEWLDNCDNDFAQLAKVSIRAMLELWGKDSILNEQNS